MDAADERLAGILTSEGKNIAGDDTGDLTENRVSGMVQMSLTVLLVEDEATLRQVIARNLASRGHLVREAATASEALQEVEGFQPDLLLLDINLPDRSGWDVLRELRDRGIEIPTVVVSAVRVSPTRLAEFKPLAYLPKPFPLEALLRVVDETHEREKTGEPRRSD